MSESNCPYCGETIDCATCTTIVVPERMLGLGGEYVYLECVACGSLSLTEPPHDLSPFYPAQSYYSFSRSVATSLRLRARRTRARLLIGLPRPLRDRAIELLPRASTPAWASWYEAANVAKRSNVLEFGCGDGGLLAELLGCGAISSAVGFDPHYGGEDPPGVRIERNSLDDVGSGFDHIFLHHSLEHVAQPYEQVEQLVQLLAPGGNIVVRVPLVDSAAAIAFGTHWCEFDAPRHLSLPTSLGIEQLAARVGLTVQASFRDGTGFEVLGSFAYALGIKPSDDQYVELSADIGGAAAALANNFNERGVGGRGCFVLGGETTHAQGSRA